MASLIPTEHFDLARRLKDDGEFRNALHLSQQRMADLEGIKARRPLDYIHQRDKIIASIWKDSGRNLSLLVPYYFPKYPKSRPMSMLDRPFNMILMFLLVHWTFVLRGSRQIGKSTSIGVRMRMIAEMVPRFRSLYIAPHMEPLKTFGRKFSEINDNFRFPVTSSKLKQNLYYRTYHNGSSCDLVKVQTSATTVRGKTADDISLDEVQLLDAGLEMEILETLNDSSIKSLLYAGTSTTSESLLELRFQEGTQSTWQVLIDNDTRTIDCGDPEQVIPCIGPNCMLHPKTGVPIDPLRGFYKHLNPAGFDRRTVSVHIPQIINPDISGNVLEWGNLYKMLVRDPKKFTQEKLGIPVAESSAEITEADLKRMCVDVPGPEERLRRVREGYYRVIVSGADWGGSDYNPYTKTKVSYTTHVILGLAPDDRVHLLFCRRHSGKDYKTIINLMAADHARYGAQSIGTDFGVGETYHEIMRSHPHFRADRHVIFHYTGPRSPVCSKMESNLERVLNLNRTETITALLVAMSMPEPLILAPAWTEMAEYLVDFLNIHRHLAEKTDGQRHFLYTRNASKPDDVVHACNFAYSLLRLTFNQLLISDPASRKLLREATLGDGNIMLTQRQLTPNGFSTVLSDYADGLDGYGPLGYDQEYEDGDYYD